MRKQDWLNFLDDVYRECRELSHWPDLYEFHDEEDRSYFLRLDELGGKI